MQSVIVTGASGFIGQSLVRRLLKQGINVFAVVRNRNCMQIPNAAKLHIIELDTSNYIRLPILIEEKVDVFYHCAWDGTFGDSFQDYHRQLNNTAMTGDALIAAKKLNCKKFVFIGTIVELEVRSYLSGGPCQPRISCIYGTAKLAAEMLCRTLGYNLGIDINSAILASVYGPGDRSKMLQNVLIHAFINAKSPKLIKGDHLYDWIYIDDVVDALVSVGENGITSQTYYIGHRTLKTFKEIVTQVRDIVNPNIPLIFGELTDSAPIDYSLIDLDLLYRDTGFEAKSDFTDSVLKTVEWVKTLDW